ncbi:MAG: hypothetical protein NTY53_05050 [Kiritimatiellaeota bacterium]|nr:hypothetical protein [Kiritimatiellota bacterium]
MSDGGNWFFDPEHTSQVNNLPGIGDTGEPAYDDPFYWGANLNSSLACDNIGFDFTVYGTGSYAGNHNGTITVRDGGSITGGSLNALYVDGGDDMNIAESYINGTVSIYSMSHNPYARLRVNGEFSQLTIASNASDLRLTAGNIIVDGGTVSIESCSGGSIGVASGSCTGNFSSANVTITGGSLSGTLDNATIYVTSSGHLVDGTSSGGVLTMDGGEITAGDWTGLSSATVTGGKISGGSFNEVNFTWPAYISSGNGGPTITSATGSGLQVYSDANQVFWMDDTATVAMPSDLVTGYYDISIISSVQIVNMEWNFKNLTIYDTGWQVLEIGSGGKLNLSGASEFSVVLNGGEIGSGDFTAASPTFTAGTISGGHYDITAVPLGITWAGGTTVSPITYNYGIITGGSFAATYETAFENSGTISGGSFEDQGFSTINNNVDCAITGGDFYCHVYNVGAISGGSFSSTVDNDYTIAGGTFSSQVANSGNITDGTFLGAVTNDEYNGGRVTGGTFEGGLSGCDLFFYPATGKGWNDIDVWKIDADGVTAADHLPNQCRGEWRQGARWRLVFAAARRCQRRRYQRRDCRRHLPSGNHRRRHDQRRYVYHRGQRWRRSYHRRAVRRRAYHWRRLLHERRLPN